MFDKPTYDAFTAQYGLINSRSNANAFASDSSYYLLCSLEILDALDAMTELCQQLGMPMSIATHGRGTATRSMMDLLGIENNFKRIVLNVASPEKTRELIRELGRDHAVILSSHILSEIEDVCSTLLILRKGALRGGL